MHFLISEGCSNVCQKQCSHLTGHALWRLHCVMQLLKLFCNSKWTILNTTVFNFHRKSFERKQTPATKQCQSQSEILQRNLLFTEANQYTTRWERHIIMFGFPEGRVWTPLLVHGQSPHCSRSPWVWRSVWDTRGENQYSTTAQCERNSVRRIISTEGSLIINWHQFGNQKVSFSLVLKRRESTHDNVTHKPVHVEVTGFNLFFQLLKYFRNCKHRKKNSEKNDITKKKCCHS